MLSGSPAAAFPAGFHAGSPPTATVPDGSPAGLNSGQQAVLDCIREHPGLRVPETEGINNPSTDDKPRVMPNSFEHYRGAKEEDQRSTNGKYSLKRGKNEIKERRQDMIS